MNAIQQAKLDSILSGSVNQGKNMNHYAGPRYAIDITHSNGDGTGIAAVASCNADGPTELVYYGTHECYLRMAVVLSYADCHTIVTVASGKYMIYEQGCHAETADATEEWTHCFKMDEWFATYYSGRDEVPSDALPRNASIRV